MSAATTETRHAQGMQAPSPLLLMPMLMLGLLYRVAIALRLLAYRLGVLGTERVQRPVVSVGNLVVGGSGKTPITDALLTLCAKADARAACLSRGYGRRGDSAVLRVRVGDGQVADPVSMGDEPALLANRHPTVPFVVGADRRQGAKLALAWDNPGLFVLDDGYQHLRLHRDLNLLLVDSVRGLGNGKLLPLGLLREPLRQVKRADAVIFTKCLPQDAKALDALEQWLRKYLKPGTPCFRSEDKPLCLLRLDGQAEMPPERLRGRGVNLFCAIAQPEGFTRTLTQLGATVDAILARPDHYRYPDESLPELEELFSGGDDSAHLEQKGGQAGDPGKTEETGVMWITTEKDAVKLRGRLNAPEKVWVLEMEACPEPAFEAFFFDFMRRHGLNLKDKPVSAQE